MNGGYVIANSKEIIELFTNISTKTENFTINGFYSKLTELYKTKKFVIVSIENESDSAITSGTIAFSNVADNFIISSVGSNVVASVTVGKNDTCVAKYLTIE